MSNKTTFTIAGKQFSLTNRHVDGTKIRMNHSAAASVIKQYVKQEFPEVTCFVSSESFSMGNSVDVHLTDERGNPASKEIKENVSAFGHLFVYGSFNSMEDIYEHRANREFTCQEGYLIEPSVKWLSVSTKPKHASLPDVYRMLTQMTSSESPYIFGQVDLEGAVRHAMSFGATQKNCDKAIVMMAQDEEVVAA